MAADLSYSLQAPLTAAGVGEAIGAASAKIALTRRIPQGLSKAAAAEALRTSLLRRNHDVWGSSVSDPDDLAPNAEVHASSTLSSCSLETATRPIPATGQDIVLQFPAISKTIESVSLLLDVEEETELEAHLLAGPANGSTIPAKSLAETKVVAPKGPQQWIDFPFASKTVRRRWHFVRITANPKIVPYLSENAPVGTLRHVQRRSGIGPRNSYTDLQAVPPAAPGPASSLCFRIQPEQDVYQPTNVALAETRPTYLPNLWISQPTDFKYPEWLELRWPERQKIGRVEIVFDASLEYRFPQRPAPSPWNKITSIVSSYRLLARNMDGKWDEFVW